MMCDNAGCDPYYAIKCIGFAVFMIVGLGLNMAFGDRFIRRITRRK